MKNLKYYSFMMLVLTACFDEQEFSVSSEVNYVAFSDTEVSVLEGADSEVTLAIIYSGPKTTAPLNVPLTISSSETTALPDIDYTFSTSISSLTIPAGEYAIPLTISILDNDEAVGPRSLVLVLEGSNSFDIGYLGSGAGQTFSLVIREDEAITFGYTSFEEPTAGDINNFSSQDGVEQVNVAGENTVDFTSVGGEMGFNTSYVPGQEGGADSGLLFGVTKFASDLGWEYDTGGFPDGSQAYSSSDADGLMEIVFDELVIPSETSILQVSLSLWFSDSSWEEDDEFDVFWRTEDGDELIISLRSDGSSMTDSAEGTGNVIVGQWSNFTADINNIKSGALVIQVGTDSGSEIAFIDNLVIKGI